MSRRKQTKPRPYVLDEESPAVAAAAGADLLLTDGRVLTEAPGGGCGQPAGGHPDHDDVMSAGCGDTASSPESARSSRRSPPAAPAAHTNGYGSSEDDNNTAQTDDHVVVSADSKVLEFSEEGCTEDVSTMDSELLKGTDELVSKDDICDQDGDKDSGDKFSVKGHVNNEGDDEDADLQEDLEYGDDDDDDDEDGMDEDEIVAAVQNGLLPNSNVMLQTLATTRVAVAQIAENNMALALEGSPGLQQTLLSLQQQQFLQLQLLHQLQHQLYRFMGAADEGGAHHAMFPPPLLPHPNMMATAEDSIDNTDSQQLPENGSSPPYIRASPPLCSSGEKKDSLVPESSDSLANLAKLANGPDPSDMLGGKSMNRNSSTSSLNKVGGKSPCGTGSGAPSVGTMLERSQYAADDPFYRHKCRFCHKVFGSDSALQIHVRSHTGEKPYKCNVCGSRFSTKGNYKVHFERHKSEFPHVEMDDRLYLDEKPQIPGPPELYKDSMALLPPPAPRPPTAPRTPPPPPPQQHGIQNLFKHHFGEEKSPKPEGSQHMPAELPNPNKFLHHGGPLGHMMVTHSTAITSISSRSPTPGVMHTSHPPLPPNMMGLPPFPDFPMFRAPSVSKQEEDDMEQFMEVEQSETGKLEALVKGIEDKLSDPNQCIICKRILSCKSSLQMHYRTHTGERPFKCKICSRAFTTKGNLKTHMGVHRSKPPLRMMHQCPVCHKQFTNGLVLQQHMRIHGGEGLKAFLPPPPMLPPMGSMGLPFPFPGLPFPMPPHMGMPPNFHINGMDLSKHPGSIDTNDDDEFDENEYDDDTGDFDENEDESMDTSDRKIRSDEETHHQKENANKYDDDQRNTSGSGGVEKVPSSTPVPYSPMKSPVNSANIPISSTFMNNQPSVITSTPAFSTSLSALENSVKAIDSFMAPKYPGFPFPEPMPHTDSRSSSVVQSESGALHDRCTPKDTNMPGNRPMDSPALSETNSSVSSLNRTHDNSNREKGSPMSSPPTSFPMNPFMHIGFNPYDSQGSVHNNHNNTCRLCLKTFSCKAELEMHERSHDSDRPYFCQVCDRSFSTESNMRQHMLTHKIKDLPSEYEKNLPSGFDKDQNSGASSPVSEAESKDASSSLSTITPPCISSTLPPMSKYSTSITTNLSPSSSVVTSSRLPSPALPSPRLPTSSGTSPLPPMFKSIPPTIPTASSSLSSSSDNSPFVRRHNPKHTCQVCQKPFSGGSALRIHMRTHTGEKPFKCEVCGKAFTTKGNLKVHMGTHMVQNGPSRRGRRMSMEGLPGFPPGPVGPKDPMPERPGGGGFNPFTPRNADMYPGFPFTVFPNGLFPPMKGMPPFPLPPTSGGPLMKGPPVSLPHDLLMKPPHPAAGLSQEMLMKAEEMLKNQQRNSGLDGLKRDMFDNNNLPGVPTSKGTSGELDLRLRKPSPAIST